MFFLSETSFTQISFLPLKRGIMERWTLIVVVLMLEDLMVDPLTDFTLVMSCLEIILLICFMLLVFICSKTAILVCLESDLAYV